MSKSLQRRMRVFILVVITVILVLTARLAWLQIYQYDYYTAKAEGNRLREIPILASRGEIKDRNGQVLATNRPGYAVSLLGLDRQKAADVIRYLSEILEIDEQEIRDKIAKQQFKSYAPIQIATDVSPEIIAQLEERRLDLPGVIYETHPVREYPHQSVAAHILGYVGVIRENQYQELKQAGYRFTDIIGQSGLEATYEKYLRGQDGSLLVETNRFGYRVRELERTNPVPGNTLHLTLDLRLQVIAENALAQVIAELKEKGNEQVGKGAIVALDPRTGGILALVSYPAFNPNTFYQDYNEIRDNPDKPEINKAIQGTYPVGSTFKLVTTFAALEEGVIAENTRLVCSGVKTFFGSDRRRCYNYTAHGSLNVVGALQKSCNIFFYEMGYRLGGERLSNYAKDFGFGGLVGLTDIRGELPGLINSPETRSDFMPGDVLSAAIGQGHAITPLQLANYAAMLANGGIHYRPHLVKEITDYTGEVVFTQEPEILRKLDYEQKHWEIARKGLEAVTELGGTGSSLRTLPVKVAGKTGSAEAGGNRISHSLFIGYAPAADPEIALAIVVENGGLGGDAAVPVAKLIFEAYYAEETAESNAES